MSIHIDDTDPRYPEAAAHILYQRQASIHETNITSAVRSFLTLTKLAWDDEIVEEQSPARGSRSAVDLTALDTFIEVKRRIGTAGGGFNPNPDHVEQLDDYLAQSQAAGKGVRMGILTDGKYWLLRWPGAGRVQTTYPYVFTLENRDGWLDLYEWLRDRALVSNENIPLDRKSIEQHFGPDSPHYHKDIAGLRVLYDRYATTETIQVKRRLWRDLLRAALGEVAGTGRGLDDLFVRHTYLTALIGLAVQASFGLDIAQLAATNPDDLLRGRQLQNKTGLQGIVESDFFAWPAEVGGLPLMQALARRIARFDWSQAPADIAAILYMTVIPADERRQLGEYYTPNWLARDMVRELVTAPLGQRVLDPACGSGTFLVAAVEHFLAAANRVKLPASSVFNRLREAVTGIDVHPVAVHLARTAWVLAARPAIEAAGQTALAVPVYLGDALQLGFRNDLLAEHEIRIEVKNERKTELVFPISLVERANDFDALMSDIADAIEDGDDPALALDDHGITDPQERRTLQGTIAEMRQLHAEGNDHIWAYYTRNLVRPVVLSRRKVDVLIGNPPWLNYNKTASTLRRELEQQSKETYGIWTGGRYATHQDVAGLFFTCSTDLYLQGGGVIGMVLPHSALQTGQYAKWRTGAWQTGRRGRRRSRVSSVLKVDFRYKPAWDLEKLEPNTFFPVAAAVVFAKRLGADSLAGPLGGHVERWLGKTGTADVRRVRAAITDTSESGQSPYASYSRQGAIIMPRCLFFVHETENPAIVQAGRTITVNPRRGSQDKQPWKGLDLTAITGQTIETQHVYDVHLGETVVPYATLDPLKAVLPVRRGDANLPAQDGGGGGVHLGRLERRMRGRWQTISDLWEKHRARATKLNLLRQIDYLGKLSSQLAWQHNPDDRPIRVVYNQSGVPTAALLCNDSAIVDKKLYWITCANLAEADYLLALINSNALYEAVTPLMNKGQFGARDLEKQLWKLPIPEYEATDALHIEIADAGAAAAAGVARELARLRQARSRVTVTIARRELRKWLRSAGEGASVEAAVGRLLG